jgi:hypothetical protein
MTVTSKLNHLIDYGLAWGEVLSSAAVCLLMAPLAWATPFHYTKNEFLCVTASEQEQTQSSNHVRS